MIPLCEKKSSDYIYNFRLLASVKQVVLIFRINRKNISNIVCTYTYLFGIICI